MSVQLPVCQRRDHQTVRVAQHLILPKQRIYSNNESKRVLNGSVVTYLSHCTYTITQTHAHTHRTKWKVRACVYLINEIHVGDAAKRKVLFFLEIKSELFHPLKIRGILHGENGNGAFECRVCVGGGAGMCCVSPPTFSRRYCSPVLHVLLRNE